MTIRSAQPDDADALGHVHVRTWQAAYAGILPDGYLAALDPIVRVDGWRQRLSERIPPAETYVAEDNGTVVGFASVGPYRPVEEPDIGEVYAIYVDPPAWSTGAGRALMRAAINHLTEAGFREIRLWVFRDNARARRFYELAGFIPDGTSVLDTTDRGGPHETAAVELRYRLLVG